MQNIQKLSIEDDFSLKLEKLNPGFIRKYKNIACMIFYDFYKI